MIYLHGIPDQSDWFSDCESIRFVNLNRSRFREPRTPTIPIFLRFLSSSSFLTPVMRLINV